MVKRILIPTDFTIESLNTLKYALQDNQIFELEVTLLYAEFLTDSITELLFYSKNQLVESRLTEGFTTALSVLENHFKEIVSIRFELLHANKTAAALQLLKINKIDEVYIPRSYSLDCRKKAFDTIPLLKSTMYPITEIDWDSRPGLSEHDQITNLFN